MKCPDKECGLEFDIIDAETTLQSDFVDLDHVDNDEVEISVTISIDVACPDCGESIKELTGEINNLAITVEEENEPPDRSAWYKR